MLLDDLEEFDSDFAKSGDHWKGEYTRASPKGKVLVSWNHVSASQIETFVKCKRLWYFKSIQKLQEGQKGHQSLGEAFHLIMEKTPQGLGYDRSDVAASVEDWDKAELMARQALPLLPQETKPFMREHGLRMPTYEGGPTMIGYIDLAIPQGVGWPAFFVPEVEAIIADYKTLSDFRYMRTPLELSESVQMMTYAKWAISPYPLGMQAENEAIPEHVRLVHMYARTKPPFNRAAIRNESVIVTPDEINSQWEKTLDIVRQMQHTSSAAKADDVEAGGALNGHCEAYGGCSFRDKCGIAKQSGIKSLFTIGKKPTTVDSTSESPVSSILEKIKAAKAQAEANAKAASATSGIVAPSANPVTTSSEPIPTVVETAKPVVTVTSNVAKGPVSGLLMRIAAQGKGQPILTGAVAATYAKENGFSGSAFAGAGASGTTTITSLGELMKLASGIVPPDAPLRAQEVITRPGEAVVDPLKEPAEDGESDDDEGEAEISPTGNPVATGVSQPLGSTGTVEVAKKRGRPSLADMAAREAAQKALFDEAVKAEVAKHLAGTDMASANEEITKLKADAQHHQLVVDQLSKVLGENSMLKRQLEQAKPLVTQALTDTGLTLYVDCFPTKGDAPVDFYEWIGPIVAQVAQANAVGDWRQINYTAKALLANAIRETVKAEGTPSAMVISTYAGGADVALEILTPLAKRVIKKL